VYSLAFIPKPQQDTKETQIEQILVLTVDGRTLTGTLESTDQVTNLVMSHTIERVIRPADDDEASTEVEHGTYLVRGDNVVVVGLVDEELDKSIDWTKVRGEVVRDTKNA
jgi:U6 snRNA-associated Sm-like protein LSm8